MIPGKPEDDFPTAVPESVRRRARLFSETERALLEFHGYDVDRWVDAHQGPTPTTLTRESDWPPAVVGFQIAEAEKRPLSDWVGYGDE